MLQAVRIVYFVVAAGLILGGLDGWLRGHSVVSGIAGVATGLLALLAAILVARNPMLGLGIGLATAILVAGGFLPRYLKAPSLYPGGLVLLLGAIALIASVAGFFAARPPAGP